MEMGWGWGMGMGMGLKWALYFSALVWPAISVADDEVAPFTANQKSCSWVCREPMISFLPGAHFTHCISISQVF